MGLSSIYYKKLVIQGTKESLKSFFIVTQFKYNPFSINIVASTNACAYRFEG